VAQKLEKKRNHNEWFHFLFCPKHFKTNTSGANRRITIIYRTLGSTGEKVSAVGVGGRHLSIPQVDEKN
jgi:hypothetical protein